MYIYKEHLLYCIIILNIESLVEKVNAVDTEKHVLCESRDGLTL